MAKRIIQGREVSEEYYEGWKHGAARYRDGGGSKGPHKASYFDCKEYREGFQTAQLEHGRSDILLGC